ncbi:MAG: hypothetical protein WD534_18790 [Phycisphaeraceae bacterium]
MSTKLTQQRQTLQWMGLRLLVPAEWQIVRHSVEIAKGSLALVDRRRQRLQVIWSDWPVKPDLKQLIGDYRAQQLDRDADAKFESLALPEPWVGVARHVDHDEMLVRAARFDLPTHRLIETALLIGREGADQRALLTELLSELEVVCRAEDATQWQAFDIHLTTPAGFRLRQAKVKPMHASLRFTGHDEAKNRPDRREARIRRIAMAQTWYKGAESMLREEDWRLAFDHRPTRVGQHVATRSTCQERGKRWQRYTGKLRQRCDLTWACERENAVYHVTTLSPRGQDVEPEDFTISCCREIIT